MAKKTAKQRLTTLAFILSLLGIVACILSRAGSWLAVADPLPPRINVIFTFGGENVRVSYSRELMRRFPQAHWVISDYTHRYSRLLQRQGIDMSRVTILDTCRYTISEVKGLATGLPGREQPPGITPMGPPVPTRRERRT